MDRLRIASVLTRLTVFVCLFAATPGWAQTEKLEFEVASVRPSKPDARQQSNFSLDNGNIFSAIGKDDVFVPSGGLFSATNMALLTYINFAYNLTGTQYLSFRFKEYLGGSGNLPKWAGEERFDIQARAAEASTKDQMRAMLRSLLEDRFKLIVHRETRQVSVLALTPVQPGKLGERLRPHPADDSCSQGLPDYPRVCGVIARLPPSAAGRMRIGGRDITMALLASSLVTQTGVGALRHPLIDETGLSGGFDFVLEWLPETPDGAAPAADASGPTFIQALKDQLGFKLVPTKGPVEVLVIDHVEEPSAN